MTNRHSRIDTLTPSLFDVIREDSMPDHNISEGSLNIDTELRSLLSEIIHASPLSRYQIGATMSELTGTDVTKTMIDAWTAESKEGHRFPANLLPAFCIATGDNRPLELLARKIGVFVMPSRRSLRDEVSQIRSQIAELNRKLSRDEMLIKAQEQCA